MLPLRGQRLAPALTEGALTDPRRWWHLPALMLGARQSFQHLAHGQLPLDPDLLEDDSDAVPEFPIAIGGVPTEHLDRAAVPMPMALQEWLPSNHLAYFISDVVDQLDLGEIESRYKQEECGYPP